MGVLSTYVMIVRSDDIGLSLGLDVMVRLEKLHHRPLLADV